MLTSAWAKMTVAMLYVAIQAACCCMPFLRADNAAACPPSAEVATKTDCCGSEAPAESDPPSKRTGCPDCQNRHVLTPPIEREMVDLSPHNVSAFSPIAVILLSDAVLPRTASRTGCANGDPGPPRVLPMDLRTTLLL